MEIQFDEDQIKEAKEIYVRLLKVYEDKADFEVMKKEREAKLKDEISSVCNIRDKDGNADSSKVKFPLVLAILNEMYRDKENPKEIEYATMKKYRTALNSGEISESLIDGFLHCTDEIKATKGYIKDIFSDATLLSSDTCKALEELAKEKYKEVYQDKMMEAGFVKEKAERDDSEYLELKENLENILES